MELLLQSRAHFADLIFQKHSAAASFLNILTLQIELSLSHVHFLLTTSRTHGNRDPASATPGATSPQKTQGFGLEGCFFSPVGSHASELLHFPTTWWWVVDMMMWLTWDPVDRMVCMHFVLNILTMFLKFYYITLH